MDRVIPAVLHFRRVRSIVFAITTIPRPSRADLVVLTRANQPSASRVEELKHKVSKVTEAKIIISEIEIDGGEGVGIVTKPGLGLELNKAAINPVPKKMINENLREITDKHLVKK